MVEFLTSYYKEKEPGQRLQEKKILAGTWLGKIGAPSAFPTLGKNTE